MSYLTEMVGRVLGNQDPYSFEFNSNDGERSGCLVGPEMLRISVELEKMTKEFNGQSLRSRSKITKAWE